MAELLEDVVSTTDLKRYERIYNDQLENHSVTTEAQFNYAWCLVRSRYAADIKKGICLLESLFRDNDENTRRDYIYFLAIAFARLKEYSKALQYVRLFLQLEPNNLQVQSLEATIKSKMEREGMLGMAVAGGVVLALGGLVSLGMALASRK